MSKRRNTFVLVNTKRTFPVTDQRLHAGVKFPQLNVQILKMLLLLLKPLTQTQTHPAIKTFIQCSHLIFIPYSYLSYFISLFLSLSPSPPFPILCSSSCFFTSLFNFPALLYIHSFLPPDLPHFQISFAFPSFIFPQSSVFLSFLSLLKLLAHYHLFILPSFSLLHLFPIHKMHFFYYHFPFWSLLLISPFLIFFHSSFSVVPLHTLY